MSSLEEYKSLIDKLVEASESMLASKLLSTFENRQVPSELQSLTSEQKIAIAQLLNEAKSSGIHDALVVLSELQNLSNLKIEVNGHGLPTEPFGTELNFDYIARLEKEEWPVL
jgi:hypothetical protein